MVYAKIKKSYRLGDNKVYDVTLPPFHIIKNIQGVSLESLYNFR